MSGSRRPGGVDGEELALGLAALAQAQSLGLERAADATAAAYRALRHFEAAPTRRGQAMARRLVGELAEFAGELGEARDHLEQAAGLFEEVELWDGACQARLSLARLRQRLGAREDAGREFARAFESAQRSADPRLEASAARELGSFARRGGDGPTALEHYSRAAAIFARLGDEAGLASVHLSLGNLLAAAGQDEEAVGAYRVAIRGFQSVGDRLGRANAERFLAGAAGRLGQTDRARRHYATALGLYDALDEPLGRSHTRRALGELEAEAGDTAAMREHLRGAVEQFARIGDPDGVLGAVERLAEACLADGDRPGALRELAWGVAEARCAARWDVGEEGVRRIAERIAEVEGRALELAVELAEPALAGAVIEGGVAGLLGLLPILLAGTASASPAAAGDAGLDRLRGRVRDLARELGRPAPADGESGPPADPPPAGEPPSDAVPPTRGGAPPPAARRRTQVIAELEDLLGRRAREVLAPARIDYPAVIEALRLSGPVAQYSCPAGLAEGRPLYVVWATPDHPLALERVELTRAVAERLALLGGEQVARTDAADAAAGPTPAGPGSDDSSAQAVRSVGELWSALDRSPRADRVVGAVAAALFPKGLVERLDAAVDEVSGVPARLRIVPGPQLWNLPWAGLVAARDGRRLVQLARVSLSPSLTCLAGQAATGRGDVARPRRVTAWIPGSGPATVRDTGVERATVAAVFGSQALARTPGGFVEALEGADAAIASVHGNARAGLGHGVYLTAETCLAAADLLCLDLPKTLVIGACWSSRVGAAEAGAEPFALPLIALARGAEHVIGGVCPLPDARPFPTARLLSHLYTALLGADPATALWLAQMEAHEAGAAPHAWAGVTHTTTALPS